MFSELHQVLADAQMQMQSGTGFFWTSQSERDFSKPYVAFK